MFLTMPSLARQSLAALVLSDAPVASMSVQGDIGIVYVPEAAA